MTFRNYLNLFCTALVEHQSSRQQLAPLSFALSMHGVCFCESSFRKVFFFVFMDFLISAPCFSKNKYKKSNRNSYLKFLSLSTLKYPHKIHVKSAYLENLAELHENPCISKKKWTQLKTTYLQGWQS